MNHPPRCLPPRRPPAAIPAGVPSGVPSGPGKAARRDSATALSATVPPTPAGVLDGPGKAARHTASGDNSLIRELGLKISRVVIDPGHGGHDQGTQGAQGLLEKDLVLDVAKRVGKLIEDRMGAEVIYTRSDDIFIPLEAAHRAGQRKEGRPVSFHPRQFLSGAEGDRRGDLLSELHRHQRRDGRGGARKRQRASNRFSSCTT